MGSSKNRKEKRAATASATGTSTTTTTATVGSTKGAATSSASGTAGPGPVAPANPNDPPSLHIPSLRHLAPSDLLERALSGNDPDLLARLHKVMTTHDVLKHVLAHVPEKDRVGVTAYWLSSDPRHLRQSSVLVANQAQFVRAARTRRDAYCSSATCPQCLKDADALIDDALKLVARVDLSQVVRGRIASQVQPAIKHQVDSLRQQRKAAAAAAASTTTKSSAAAAIKPSPATSTSAAAVVATKPQPAPTSSTSRSASPTLLPRTHSPPSDPFVDPSLPQPSAHLHPALSLRVPLQRTQQRRRARMRISPRLLQYPHRIAAAADGAPHNDPSAATADADNTDPAALLRLASDLTENHAEQFLSTMQKMSTAYPSVTVHEDADQDHDDAKDSLASHLLSHLHPASARPLAATHFDPDADTEVLGDDDAWLSATCTPAVPARRAGLRASLADRGVHPRTDVFGSAGLYDDDNDDASVLASSGLPPSVGACDNPIVHALAHAKSPTPANLPASGIVYDAKHAHMVPVVARNVLGTLHVERTGPLSAFKPASAPLPARPRPVGPPAAAKARGAEGGKPRWGRDKDDDGDAYLDEPDLDWAACGLSDPEAEGDGRDRDDAPSDAEDVSMDEDEPYDDEDEDDDDGSCNGGHEDDDEDDAQDDCDDHDGEHLEEEPAARADDVRSSKTSLPSCATGPVPCGANCIHHTGSTAKLCGRHAKGVTYPAGPTSDADVSKDRPDAAAYLSAASRYTLVSIACEFLAEQVQYQYRQFVSERAAQQLLAEERAAEQRKADAKRRRAEHQAAKKEAKRLEREAEERKERERAEAELREKERKDREREEKKRKQAEAKAKVEAERARAREERERKAEAERAAAEAKRQAKAAAQAAQAAVEKAKAEKAERDKREREDKERKAKEDKERKEREDKERKEREAAAAAAAAAAKAAVPRKREPSVPAASSSSGKSTTGVPASTHGSRKSSAEPVPMGRSAPTPATAKKGTGAAPPQLKSPAPPVSRASPVSHEKPSSVVTPPSLGVSLPLSPSNARLQLPTSNGSSPSTSTLPHMPTTSTLASPAASGGLTSPVAPANVASDPVHASAPSPTPTSTPSTSLLSASSSAPTAGGPATSHTSSLPSPVPSTVSGGSKPPQPLLHDPHQAQQQQQQPIMHPGMPLGAAGQQLYPPPPPPAFAYQQALAMGLPMYPGAPGANPHQFMYNPAHAAAVAAASNGLAQYGGGGVPGMYPPPMPPPSQQPARGQGGMEQHGAGMTQHVATADTDAASVSGFSSAAPSVAGAPSDRGSQLGMASPNVHLSLGREPSLPPSQPPLPSQFQSPLLGNGSNGLVNGSKYGLGAEAWGPNTATATGASNGSHHSVFEGFRLGAVPSDLTSSLSTTSSTGNGTTGAVNGGSNTNLPGPINTAMAAASATAGSGSLGSALLSGSSSIWSPFAASDPFDDLRSPTTATASVNSASMAGSRFANLAGVQQAAAASSSSVSVASPSPASATAGSPWGPPALQQQAQQPQQPQPPAAALAVSSSSSSLGSRAAAASYRGLGAAALPSGLADALDMDDDLFDPFGFPSKPVPQVPQPQQQARGVNRPQQQQQVHGYHHPHAQNGWSDHHASPSSLAAPPSFGYGGNTASRTVPSAQYIPHHIQQPPAHQHQHFNPHHPHQHQHHQLQQQQFTAGMGMSARGNGFPPGSMFARSQQQVESRTGGY